MSRKDKNEHLIISALISLSIITAVKPGEKNIYIYKSNSPEFKRESYTRMSINNLPLI